MKRMILGLLLMLIGSVAVGILSGNWYFHLFRQTVPPAVLTSFNQATAHGAFLLYGFVIGAVIFLWSLLVLALARFFRRA